MERRFTKLFRILSNFDIDRLSMRNKVPATYREEIPTISNADYLHKAFLFSFPTTEWFKYPIYSIKRVAFITFSVIRVQRLFEGGVSLKTSSFLLMMTEDLNFK